MNEMEDYLREVEENLRTLKGRLSQVDEHLTKMRYELKQLEKDSEEFGPQPRWR